MRWRKFLAGLISASLLCSISLAPCTAAKPQEESYTNDVHIALSREAATEGMVLLKNEEALPLPGGEKVALFGCGQIRFQKGGGGSGDVNTLYVRNLLEGMQIKEAEGKLSLYQPLVQAYTAYTASHENGEMPLDSTLVEGAAQYAGTAIVTITRYSSEGYDRNEGKGDFLLSDGETAMLDAIARAGFQRVVAVLNIGGIIDLSWIDTDKIDGALLAWQAGIEGGLAAADLLVGDVNPSGKLADTIAREYADYPCAETWNESEHRDYIRFTEDIFVGYRYFETIPGASEKVLYPFGFGLSYTDFALSDISTVEENGQLKLQVKVTNTGEVAGKEVVQVYFSAPQADGETVFLDKASRELAAFQKTELLAPGESQILQMHYAVADMAGYDDAGKTGHPSAYLLEPGEYRIYLGNSLTDANARGVCYTYVQPELEITEQLTKQLTAYHLDKRLKADGTYEALEETIIHTLGTEGYIRLSAESYSDASAGVRLETYSEYGESNRCLAGLSGGSVEFQLEVEETGFYPVQLRMANGLSSISDMLQIYVNGKLQEGLRFDMASTGGYYNFTDLPVFKLGLTKGSCTIRLAAGGSCANLESILIGELPEVPAIAVKDSTLIQAEDFTELDARARTEAFDTVDGSGVCLADLSAEGSFAVYRLRVETAGTYQLTLRASNGWGRLENMLRVEVDGVDQQVVLSMDGTGSAENPWHRYVDLEPVQVTLPAGVCTLKLISNGTCGNLDAFTLTRETGHAAQLLQTAAPASPITLLDVYQAPEKMEAFLEQMELSELALLACGQRSILRWQTGGFGNQAKYGIPNAQMLDGPAGIHTYESTTAWPVASLLACTWNTALLERIGAAAAEEGLAAGADIWLAPALNIHRNILCGRNFEYYSEDPLISGKMAAAITCGTQEQGLGVSIKHFAANNREENRNNIDSRISERALREIYLKGFQIVVEEAKPWTVMSSYNYLNGQECSERRGLLTTILREEWGFDGMVMTDWGNNAVFWREIKAGNNLRMPGGSSEQLVSAVEEGLLTREELEANAVVILKLILKTNSFQTRAVNPSSKPVYGSGTTRLDAAAYTWLSRGAGTEACSDEDVWLNLSDLGAGAWVEYTLDVARSGEYQAVARVASYGGGGFDAYLDGEKIGSYQNHLNTGDWQSWATSAPVSLSLTAGKHALRLEITQSGMNLAWLELTAPHMGYAVNGNVSAGESGCTDLGGLRIEAYDPAGGEASTVWASGVTDAQGRFTLDRTLPDGDYSLRLLDSSGRYRAQEADITVAGGAVSEINLLLQTALCVGDIDKDGSVTVSDVVELRKWIVSGEADPAICDLDKDGSVTVSDVVELRRIIVQGN